MAHVLKIDHAAVTDRASNYYLSSLREVPRDDFPVVVDAEGQTVCTYGSASWPLWPYGGPALTFGDEPSHKASVRLDTENARLQRRIALWLLWGDHPTVSATTIYSQHQALRGILRLCSEQGILACDLMRFPAIRQRLPDLVQPSGAPMLLSVLLSLYASRDALGFVVLDYEAIETLRRHIPLYESQQHPYMPPRIYTYVGMRLLALIDDYLRHQEAIDALYRHCVQAYLDSFGSPEAAFGVADRATPVRRLTHSPFGEGKRSFRQVARDFGVEDVIERWVGRTGLPFTIVQLGRFLTAVQFAGRSYLVQTTGMRRKESASLRADCVRVDDDPVTGRVVIVQGATTKTRPDPHAQWVAAPSAERAVKAMAGVARLRLGAAELNPRVSVPPKELANPHLLTRSFEPWTPTKFTERTTLSGMTGLGSWQVYCERLFDATELTIGEEDWHVASIMTPGLDRDRYGPGLMWPLKYHSMRRTLLVNASHEGVSLESLQLQAKHANSKQTEYYRTNYSRLSMNPALRQALLDEKARSQVAAVQALGDDRFVSPLGERHKAALTFLSSKSANELLGMAKQGKLAVRRTLCGLCLFDKPCPYGGLDHIQHCVGTKTTTGCADALLDHARADAVAAYAVDVRQQYAAAEPGSPRSQALAREIEAVEKAHHVLFDE